MNKTFTTIVLVAMLAFAAYFGIKGRQAEKSHTPPNVYTSEAPAPAPVQTTTDAPIIDAAVSVGGPIVIERSDKGFSPATIVIKKGDTVIFKNTGTEAMWPASDPHPAHTEYPISGGCRASAFDACTPIAPGASWSFTFLETGAWSFHDHLAPQFKGIITVK